MTQTPQTPAGWYPQGDVQRWWDGNAWTEHTHPLPGAQPTMQQPAVQAGQPAYGAPAYGAPQPYQPPQPAQKSHTARNVLIVIGALFLLLVGGCVAVGVVLTDKVNEVVNDDSEGGPNNPKTIEPGEAFEVNGYEYADGWSVGGDASGIFEVRDLKLTNNRGKADRLFVYIKLLNDNEVLATATCSNTGDKIPEGVTVTVNCTSSDSMPAEYDKVTINDII